MIKAMIHVSEEEAVRNLPALLARVRAGAEIVIENASAQAAILRAAEPRIRSISESIALAKAYKHFQMIPGLKVVAF